LMSVSSCVHFCHSTKFSLRSLDCQHDSPLESLLLAQLITNRYSGRVSLPVFLFPFSRTRVEFRGSYLSMS
ncbi:hypothetical protein SK128_007556, partial [Halocaridina rubra]